MSGEPGPPSPPVRDGRVFGPLDKPGSDLKDGKPWSDADDEVLRANVAAGCSLPETAARLGRSDEFTVYQRAKHLGLKQWQPSKRSPKSRRK